MGKEIHDAKEWLNNNELSYNIWKKKYCYNNETFDEWLDRVSGKNEKIKQLILDKKFLFGGRTLSNRGTSRGSYSNCYSIGYVPDSLEEIMNVAHDIAMTFKSQGGQGLSLSKIRPKGSLIHGQFESDGIVPFMEIFNTVTESISQGGCISENELIQTDCGYKPIKDIKKGDMVWTKVGFVCVDELIDKGEQETVKVITQKGYEITVTPDHKFSFDGFNKKPIKDFCIGDDLIIIAGNCKKITNFIPKAYIAANYFANGYMNPIKNGGDICTGNRMVALRLQECFQQLGYSPKIREEFNAYRVVLTKDICDYLISLNIVKNNCYDIKIPDWIINGDDDIVVSFFSGLLDSDGTVYDTKWKYNTVCKSFAKDIQKLVSRIGGFPSMHEEQRAYPKNNLYTITDSFRINYPLLHSVKAEEKNITNAKNSRLSTPYTKNLIKCGNCVEHLTKIGNNEKIGLYTFLQINTEYVPIVTDKIVSIEECGKHHVYDIVLPKEHMFNCNGLYVSNSRKGALLMSLDVNHPEAETFITIKSDLKKINKANLSLEIDDEFMNNLDKEDNNRKWKLIAQQACKYAEPGIIFTNRFRNYNIMQYVDEYQIENCNPCGEQPLPKHGACNLCSINISEYIVHPFEENACLDDVALCTDVKHIVEAMDDVLEENLPNHALAQQRAMAERFRNVGIGIMGLHDALIKLGLVYGSDEAVDWTRSMMKKLFKSAVWASVELGRVKGNFPGYDSRVWDSEIMKHTFTQSELDTFKEQGWLRNCSLLSVAPTGSIGTMLNISTGVEPFFALSYTRRTVSLDGKESFYQVDVPVVEEARNNGVNEACFITSNDINYVNRINMQSAMQEFVDTAISSTINLPKSTTPEQVEELYKYAWKMGLKGVTIYVDGSRDAILSTDGGQKKQEKDCNCNCKTTLVHSAPRRPKTLPCDIKRFRNGGDKWIACVGLYQGEPYEIFTGLADKLNLPDFVDKCSIIKNRYEKEIMNNETGKNELKMVSSYDLVYTDKNGDIQMIENIGGAFRSEFYSVSKLISALLRHGMPIEYVVSTIKSLDFKNDTINSWKSGVIRTLKCYIKDGEVQGEVCPECGSKIVRVGGCMQCSNPECGWSKCGG